ncbi:MAG: 2Fe-2S iron-sulfur cluster binding domain-containing protein [Fimbriimonadaceae bacterium]|nr:2Fe-2S iron-sulfur cluster binding domain-containing protein [Alphaproteobacteria bacterium]
MLGGRRRQFCHGGGLCGQCRCRVGDGDHCPEAADDGDPDPDGA